jgi:hypothetical protein
MSDAARQNKQEELERLRRRVSTLEAELNVGAPPHWQASSYYGMYHATSGLVLGMLGAIASLLFNVVGSWWVGQHPLRLIQVYLTFPLGERALSPDFSSGVALAIGCTLYVGTGMILGVPFQMLMAAVLPNGSLWQRLGLATVIGLLLWAINFYLILSWLQPLLFGGDWITDASLLPPWVGAATHLVFAWTMALLYPIGAYVPYRRQTEQHARPMNEA